MPLAQIITGASAGSRLVRVALSGNNGTSILVYRGELLLGSGVLASGLSDVALSVNLATGDIIQASVGSKGTSCGSPVLVQPSDIRVTGWKTPTEIHVVHDNGEEENLPASLFLSRYKYLPASIYDPAGLGAIVQPEYVQPPVSSIQFDVLVERQSGQTTVTVNNVQNAIGGPLVRFNNGSWGNALTQSFTVAGDIVIDVKGADDVLSNIVSKTITIAVVTLPPAPAPNPALKFWSWRDFGGGTIKVELNATTSAQARLNGGAWFDMQSYALYYYESLFGQVPDGSVTVEIRAVGDTDPNKYVTMNFQKGY